jgi:hypothetical protein
MSRGSGIPPTGVPHLSVFDNLRDRLERLLERHTPPSDSRAGVASLHAAMIELRVGLRGLSDAIATAERDLTSERRHLTDAERRGRLAAHVPDPETVEVANRFVQRHRERVDVLERKLVALRAELALSERDYTELLAQVRVGGPDPGTTSSTAAALEDEADLLQLRMDRTAREAAAEAQLAALKAKLSQRKE